MKRNKTIEYNKKVRKSLWQQYHSGEGEIDEEEVPPLFFIYNRVKNVRDSINGEINGESNSNNHLCKECAIKQLDMVLKTLAMYDEVGVRYTN